MNMHSLRNILGFVALASLTTLAACDQSKPALDKATADLAAVTTERDGLKAQLAASNNQLVALRAQVTDLQAKLVAATPPPAPAVVEEQKPEPAKKGKKSAKPEAKAQPAAAPLPAGATAGPAVEAKSGRKHF
jgi:hypothetical protein